MQHYCPISGWLGPIGLKNVRRFNIQWGVKLDIPIPVHLKLHFSQKPTLYSECTGRVELSDTDFVLSEVG